MAIMNKYSFLKGNYSHLLALFLYRYLNFFQKSDYCNCVVVEQESDFTGKWLKHANSTTFSVRKTEECISLDVKIDNGTGAKDGRVRWAECLSGPDCNEAGNF